MQLESELAEPVPPELPLSPELSEPAAPSELTSPVSPESAVPEVSVVSLSETEPAGPEEPPAVRLPAVELPEPPEVAVVVGSLVASPLPPDPDSPMAPDPEATDGGGGGGSAPMTDALWGLASEEPDPPELLEESFVELAAPVPPVVPEVVSDPVLVVPEVAEELEVAEEDTEPLVPALPEFPLLAEGEAVAEPLEADPVFPLPPLAAASVPSQWAS